MTPHPQAMTIPEILKELELYTGRFPMVAMQAAVEQREAITPELLRVLESVADDPAKWAERKEYMLHLFAMFLLAQFREKRAYPLIIRMFSAPGETTYDLAGDVVTEGLKRIIGSVYDGNAALLQGLVENDNAYEFVRGAAVEAFVVLKESGQMSREEVAAYYQSLFRGKLKRIYSQVWDALVCTMADLPAPELLEDVRQAYADGLVDPGFARLSDLERELRDKRRWRTERYGIITDAISEMSWWSSFKQKEPGAVKQSYAQPASPPSDRVPRPPARSTKIGRNDPCPCGSGKKYKKCCGKG
jgi:hypothetical protein